MGDALGTDAREIFAAALKSCTVERAFTAKASSQRGDGVCALRLRGFRDIDLAHVSRIIVIALGKAAATMADAFLEICPVPAGCLLEGVVIAPSAPRTPRVGFEYFAGGHPSPNQASFDGAKAALALLGSAAEQEEGRTFCFFLISGGGSAMMELPLDPGITLDETIGFHRALVGGGASIAEINCVRKHFSAVKGGRLALAAGRMRHLSILLSDVPADHLDALSSGPTLADSTTVEQCQALLQKYDLIRQFPESVRRYFQSSSLADTPKPGDFAENTYVLLSPDDLADTARRYAEGLGYVTVVDNTCDDWDYRDAADYLLERVRSLQQEHDRVCVISVGEVAVQLGLDEAALPHEAHGIGGRNSHFALYCATRLRHEERLTILSAGSDGVDGNSVAAGAVTDVATFYGRETEAQQALRCFDSFPFLDGLEAAIFTGPTGNNLRDLRILLSKSDA